MLQKKKKFKISSKHSRCTHLISNAVALSLILRVAQIQNIHLSTIENILLLGDRIPTDTFKNITKQFENVQKVMVCFCSFKKKKQINYIKF